MGSKVKWLFPANYVNNSATAIRTCHGNPPPFAILTWHPLVSLPPPFPLISTYVKRPSECVNGSGGTGERNRHTGGGCSHWVIKWRLCLWMSSRDCLLSNRYMAESLSSGLLPSLLRRGAVDSTCRSCASIAPFLFHVICPLQAVMAVAHLLL